MPTTITEPQSVSGILPSNESTAKAKGTSLNTDTFLQLLVAQIQYQDPLSPQTDAEFITQLAQMSSLEEMQKLNSTMSTYEAYGLVGQYVYAEVTDSQTGEKVIHTGVVDSVMNYNGSSYAVIGTDAVKVSDINQVFDPNLLKTDTTLTDASALIGKTVTWQTKDENGQTVENTGVVDKVVSKKGIVYAYIGEKEVSVGDITGIGA